MSTRPALRYAFLGWLLFGLFAFRVIAQPLALVVHVGLPPFESWHSATLPYGVLLAAQALILAIMGWTNYRFSTSNIEPQRRIGVVALSFGSLYCAAMLARLVLGLTILSRSRWFASPIPTVFHLVLAGWILLYGHFNVRFAAGRASGR